MDGSKGQPKITAGLDLGDRYSYLCLIDTGSSEEWALRRYLTMDVLEEAEKPNPQLSRH